MSDTLRPWLADAVSQYRQSHGRNLTFNKKGRLLQLTQYNNYRNTTLPEERETDVYAWAHDKAYEVLLRFDSGAVNAFEEKHESFTSYRYGLFHIQEFQFILGTDYISEEPRSNNRFRTFADLPQPRMFYLLVTKFNYISSKGESNFAPRRLRKFEELTRNWQINIEADEEKKRGLVVHNTASQIHTHDSPPSLKAIQAAAEVLRAKRKSINGSPGKSPKRRQTLSRSLNLNNMPATPQAPTSVQDPQAPASKLSGEREDLVEEEILLEGTGGAEEDQAILPSTPPPPSSSQSTSTTVTFTTVKVTPQAHTGPVEEPPPSLTKVVTANSTGLPADGESTTRDVEIEGALPSGVQVSGVLESRKTASDKDLVISQDSEDVSQRIFASKHISDDTDLQVLASTPTQRKRKVDPLPRFPLDSQDSSAEFMTAPLDSQRSGAAKIDDPLQSPRSKMETSFQASSVSPQQPQNKIRPITSMLVGADFLKDPASSPQVVSAHVPYNEPDVTTLAATSFYGPSKPLFREAWSPPQDNAPDRTATRDPADSIQLQETQDPNPSARRLFFEHEEGETGSSVASVSGASSDGFEFVSFRQGQSEDMLLLPIKQEDNATPILEMATSNLVVAQHVESSAKEAMQATSSSSSTSPDLPVPPFMWQLRDFSRHDVEVLLRQVQGLTSKTRSPASFGTERPFTRSKSSTSSSSTAALRPGRNGSYATVLRDMLGNTKTNGFDKFPNRPKERQAEAGLRVESKRSKVPDGISYLSHRQPTSQAVARPDEASDSAELPTAPVSASRRYPSTTIEQKDARKAIAVIMTDIKERLETKGLTRRQGIDLWYCCSGRLDTACQIADSHLDIVRSSGKRIVTNGLTSAHDFNTTSQTKEDLYKHCWTFEDDQAVEDPSPDTFKVARKLQEIESRRGKGSISARRRFLSENSLVKKLSRKPRYPYD